MKNFDLVSVAGKFKTKGTVVEISPLGNGLINDTWLVSTREEDAPDYVLQRINSSVFKDVEGLQRNIELVTSHLARKLADSNQEDISRRVLEFIPLSDDSAKTFHYDGRNYWRLSRFISDSRTLDIVTPETARLAGIAFGKFQADLSDMKDQLVETIPDFHNIGYRLRQLREALERGDSGRVSEVRPLIDVIFEAEEEMVVTERLHKENKLPKRICHCDTKVNNILFDRNNEILCVIDLDTVMPSFIFSDYGDFLRTAASNLAEDDPDIEKLDFRMEVFRSFTRGYLSEARTFLTTVEIELLPHAVTLFPYMQAVRFLTDYLNGDKYYKISYPDHNLVRARNQLALFDKTRALAPEFRTIIADILCGL